MIFLLFVQKEEDVILHSSTPKRSGWERSVIVMEAFLVIGIIIC